MLVKPIKTNTFSVKQDLIEFIVAHINNEELENSVLAITSKIVSLSQSSLKHSNLNKEELVKTESDFFLGKIGFDCFLTIKEGLLIPSAGIDESNSESGDYILYPRNPFQIAHEVSVKLKNIYNLENFGVVLTDSHTLPLRRGVVGICLSYAGFRGVRSLVGEEDLFGRRFKMASVNIADALATSATFLMGEGSESCPLALIKNVDVSFTNERIKKDEIRIGPEDDLYGPIYKNLINLL